MCARVRVCVCQLSGCLFVCLFVFYTDVGLLSLVANKMQPTLTVSQMP